MGVKGHAADKGKGSVEDVGLKIFAMLLAYF